MREAGFEPAHPEITELKPVALDHSAIHAIITVTLPSQTFLNFSFWFRCILFWVLLNLGPNNASITTHPSIPTSHTHSHTHTHTHTHPHIRLLLLRCSPQYTQNISLNRFHAETRSQV